LRSLIYDNFAKAFEGLSDEILNKYEYISSPRGKEIREITNLIFQIKNPYENLFDNKVRGVPHKYLAGELLWYFYGSNRLSFIENYSKFWNSISNIDGSINSAYGYLLFKDRNIFGFSEWEWALKSLIKDKDSRQALIRFNKPIHSFEGVKDFVCTLNGIFQIRNNKLDFTIIMRSNDLIRGLSFDYPFFSLLHQQMHLHLLKYYPDLDMGTYTHHAASLHIYEEHFDLVNSMLKEEYQSIELRMKELFVDENGNCNFEITNMYDNSSYQYTGSDPMLKWISENR